MKAQILKIAGVKSEKEFYKKYKTEADFMKVHSKAFKKAQMGIAMDANNNGTLDYLENSMDDPRFGQTGNYANAPQQNQGAPTTSIDTTIPISNVATGNTGKFNITTDQNPSPSFDVSKFGINHQTLGKTTETTTTEAPSWTGSMFKTPGIPTKEYADKNNTDSDGETQRAYDSSAQSKKAEESIKGQSNPAKAIPILGDVIGGIQDINAKIEANKYKKQAGKVLDIQAIAEAQKPNIEEHYYDSPEQNVTDANTLSPSYGVGSNAITRNGGTFNKAENGTYIGGNPTEIQNTYAPNTLYDDLGYEPLGESDMSDEDIVKQYRAGGFVHKAAGGIDLMGGLQGAGSGGGSSGGARIGGAAGSAFGSPWGMAASFVGGALDTTGAEGDALDRDNEQKMAGITNSIKSRSLGQTYHANRRDGGEIQSYEDGGYMNPEYNPQVIAMFGDHNSQDFADYAHKDQYRAGGHLKAYTPPSNRAMEIYEDGGDVRSSGLGGELQTHWGGGAETLSRNPYLPGTGETVMFRGKSHEEYSPNGETGIGVTYGGNPVEVERGEPMVELEEGGVVDPETGEVQKSGVVFGNLKIPNQYLDLLGDKSAKGKKFKNYVADLSKLEERQNKVIEKSINELNGFTPTISSDKLKVSGLEANIRGANMNLKQIAERKINAAGLQNAINDTAEEHGLVADDLARGIVKKDDESRIARWGDAISKAAGGKTVSTETTAPPKMTRAQALAAGYKPNAAGNLVIETKKAVAPTKQTIITPGVEGVAGRAAVPGKKYVGNPTAAWKAKYNTPEKREAYNVAKRAELAKDPEYAGVPAVAEIAAIPETSKVIETPGTPAEYKEIETAEPTDEEQGFNPLDLINTFLPYFRPTDQEAFDTQQINPELYALSNNQLQPVFAQGYQPQLKQPYDISLQNVLNANQADFNASQKLIGYNPEAQSILNAQKYQANQGVLGDQFRANQEMKSKVYGENTDILNQAKLTNLGIYDKQYERQSQAVSNTGEKTQAALSSIYDKMAKHKLENKTLGVYENLYNYRYDDKGKAVNMNPFAKFNTQMGGKAGSSKGKGLAEGKGFTYDENGNIVGVRSLGKEDTGKNGKSIKSKNGSIVRSYKNI